jgi:undecaprenyl diphosphate synthase
MSLFLYYLNSELEKLLENDIRLRAVGALERLPAEVLQALERNVLLTKENKALDLVLAVSYGGREEIVSAARRLAEEVKAGRLLPEEIDTGQFSSRLWTHGIPDPDLLIRTSGEQRISNFLLWQLAYAEIVVRPEFWPDFNEALFDLCLEDYAGRERRFGLTSEQIHAAVNKTI